MPFTLRSSMDFLGENIIHEGVIIATMSADNDGVVHIRDRAGMTVCLAPVGKYDLALDLLREYLLGLPHHLTYRAA